MLILLAMASIATLLFSHHVPDILAILTSPFQNFCIHQAPDSPHRELFLALVCGKRLPPSEMKIELVQTALIHLVVASGSHLVVIESLVRRLFKNVPHVEGLVAFTLGAYSLFAGLCPPFLRVLLTWGLRVFCSRWQLGWTQLQILTIAGFLTLLLCNRETELLSLALSWIAGLAVHLVSDQAERTNKKSRDEDAKILRHLSFHSLFYLLMIPALLPLAVPHPISILWNLLLGPVLAVLLFPLAALSFVLPQSAVFVINLIFDQALALVSYAADLTPRGLLKARLPLIWIWIYFFFLLIAAHWIEARSRRCARRVCR